MTHLFKLGFEVEIPDGYEIQVRSKSGLALKEGLVVLNSPGTVDQNYRGEVGVILYATLDGSSVLNSSVRKINKGQKIAQIVLCPVTKCEWEKVDELNETTRGEGGYGSTGV